jgi:transcriptional regulator with PAS, ATPase and Fis domain
LFVSAEHAREVQKISDDALNSLCNHNWPGNIREMENVLGMAMVTMRPQDKIMEIGHLPLMHSEAAGSLPPASGLVRALKDVLDEAESNAIKRALIETEGSRIKAASLLQISMRSLFYKIEKHGIK